MLTKLGSDKMFLDYGPMQMIITAMSGERFLEKEIRDAADYARELLTQLVQYLPIAKRPAGEIKEVKSLPEILTAMLASVKRCGDPTLTPMAAVAGTFSDFIADYLVGCGASKAIVNNGGDIALRLYEGEKARVGIVSNISARTYNHIVKITAEDKIKGIATSGFGGRSFTKGVASATVVFAENCRDADAAATLIGNHTFSPDPAIKQGLAEEIDPDTDMQGHQVTLAIGKLSPDTWTKALESGVKKTKELMDLKIIQGAAIFVGPSMEVIPGWVSRKILPVSS